MPNLPVDQVVLTETAALMLERIAKAYSLNTSTILSIALEDFEYTSFATMERKIARFAQRAADATN